MCCLTWKAQSARIKILAFMLMLAGWLSCTVLGVRNCSLLYWKISSNLVRRPFVYVQYLLLCGLRTFRNVCSVFSVNRPSFTADAVHRDVNRYWQHQFRNFYNRQILSVGDNMASCRKDRIELLILDVAQENFCSFCTNFNISTVIDLNYWSVLLCNSTL